MFKERNKTEYRPLLADLSGPESRDLCAKLREDLVDSVSRTGGHLASNLGAVELTVALHRVFDTAVDRLVFDVGHQCYIHKMLTGRGDAMSTMRQYGGLSGFPKPGESVHDAFIAGHASNSVAVALGMAQARSVLGEDYKVIALIGDGALTGGLAYEGLSNAGEYKGQLLVVLNDNGMSITPNVGGVAEHLSRQRMKPQYLAFKKWYRRVMNASAPGRKIYGVTHRLKQAMKRSLLPTSMFENMGFRYMGPVDGHDLDRLTELLRYARDMDEPVLLHVRTHKGKGYEPAERNPDAFHGVAPFHKENGALKKAGGENFSAVFGRTLTRLAQEDGRVCAITAAMMSGTGLREFAQAYPERFFDVGIAEGCAVSMAAGMAKQGAIPVFAVYSTFLQRAYDMLLHDVALDGLHVVFGVDRAGLVGDDGETHQGIFDAAYLDTVPGMTVLAPSSFAELKSMLERAVRKMDGPVAIRYPRGGEGRYTGDSGEAPSVILREGGDITLAGFGLGINDLLDAAEILNENNVNAEVVKLNCITPIDGEVVSESAKKTGTLLVCEDNFTRGSVGRRLAACLEEGEIRTRLVRLDCGEAFVHHGSVPLLKKELGLDGAGIARRALEVLGRG